MWVGWVSGDETNEHQLRHSATSSRGAQTTTVSGVGCERWSMLCCTDRLLTYMHWPVCNPQLSGYLALPSAWSAGASQPARAVEARTAARRVVLTISRAYSVRCGHWSISCCVSDRWARLVVVMVVELAMHKRSRCRPLSVCDDACWR